MDFTGVTATSQQVEKMWYNVVLLMMTHHDSSFLAMVIHEFKKSEWLRASRRLLLGNEVDPPTWEIFACHDSFEFLSKLESHHRWGSPVISWIKNAIVHIIQHHLTS